MLWAFLEIAEGPSQELATNLRRSIFMRLGSWAANRIHYAAGKIFSFNFELIDTPLYNRHNIVLASEI